LPLDHGRAHEVQVGIADLLVLLDGDDARRRVPPASGRRLLVGLYAGGAASCSDRRLGCNHPTERPVSPELYAHTCGFLTIPHGFLLEAAEGWITVPIPSYLIVHPAGKVLFDSGLNLRTQIDPEPYIGRAGSKYATFHFHPG